MTKDEQGYNGWTNYETWQVNLWLSNGDPRYAEYYEIACGLVGDTIPCGLVGDTLVDNWKLADWLEEQLTEFIMNQLEGNNGLEHDMLRGVLGNVNWREIVDGNRVN